ncbi:MAG: response regulator transcription factor [Bifidobacteriaceae bacterium]|jgi:two-component system response regulator RegX3|nr:response regulator transcription factor [Bifidobacteriaceae bacterium]
MSDRKRLDCLVVDDEAALSEATVEYFTMLGTSATWVADAAGALTVLANHDVGLILLDINLEGESGFAVCRRLRRDSDVPILFISARGGGDDDILLALAVGGDDYIAKPYSLAVLHAKVQAALRRAGWAGGAPAEPLEASGASAPAGVGRFDFGRLSVRFDLGRAYGPDGPIGLTDIEYRLLARLAAEPGRVIPKRQLFAAAWGHTAVSDGALNVHIRRLRAKLAAAAAGHDAAIATSWGTGYALEPSGLAQDP